MATVTTLSPVVFVVDDDDYIREALLDLLKEFGFQGAGFRSAEEFLASGEGQRGQCLILDVAMPGMTGPELQAELARSGCDIPIVFVTAQTDAVLLARLVRGSAKACLSKPFADLALVDAVEAAIASRPPHPAGSGRRA